MEEKTYIQVSRVGANLIRLLPILRSQQFVTLSWC